MSGIIPLTESTKLRLYLISEVKIMKQLTFITGNRFKVLSAEIYSKPLGVELIGRDINCPEIQADTVEEVAIFSSQYASEQIKMDTLKNDCGITIPALNGFPGAYTKYVDYTLGVDGILALMNHVRDRQAVFVECYALTEYGKGTKVFFSRTEGMIAEKAQGEFGTNWDKVFIPKGYSVPLACFDDDQRAKMWDGTGIIEAAKYYASIG